MSTHRLRILVIHNPVAGWQRRGKLRRVVRYLRLAGARVTELETEAPGDAIGKARAAEDFDVIVVAGGDGTVNEVINGLGENGLPVAFIPLGTANVLAWELGLPRSPRALARVILEGRTRRVFPGIVNGRRFVLMVGVGLDAWAVERVHLGLKRHLGRLAYVGAVLSFSFLGTFRYGPYRVRANGEEFEATSVVVTRARRYAGPFVIAPGADLGDRFLTVVAVNLRGLANVVRYGAAVAFGRLDWLPDVKVVRAACVTVTGPEGDPVQGDGDIVGRVPFKVSVDEKPIHLIVPGRR